MLARKGLLPDGFLLTRLAEDQNQPNRGRSKSQRARFITKTGSCNVAHKNIREQVPPGVSMLAANKHRLMSTPHLWLSGSVSAGRFHHHGGPEVAALLPHLHLGLPLLLDALRYDLVVVGLRPWRPGTPGP